MEKKLRLKYELKSVPSGSEGIKFIKLRFMEMDEYFRYISDEYGNVKMFSASNGWTIRSFHYPAVNQYTKTIHLRGSDKNYDNDDIILAVTNKEEKQMIKDIREALKEWADNYEFPDKIGR